MYFRGMENAAKDYQKLYEESLLTIAEKEKELIQERKHNLDKDQQITQLNFELAKFRRYLFGSKSEKRSVNREEVSQLHLFELGTTEQQQQELSQQVEQLAPEAKNTPKKRAKGSGRMQLPEALRREIIVIEPEEDTTGCTYMGDDITEVLDVIPAEVYVKRYVLRQYARPHGAGILTGELPERVIKKGIPSNQLVAQVILDKYVYGLPLHRQIAKYRQLGVNLPASTVSDWLLKGWKHLVPLWVLLKKLIVQQHYLQADESPIKVQDKQGKVGKPRKIHQGYMWVYHAPADKLVFFDYRKGRDRSGPKAILEGYSGILQTDGYSVYESLYGQHPGVMLVYCMAHARRKFVDARKYDESKVDRVLNKMQQLYALEQHMREEQLSWTERTTRRQQKAVPVLDQIKALLEEYAGSVVPSSPLGQAISYTLPRWSGLSAYAQHGQIEIDNNLVENDIRPLAVGRKNFLFAGSHDAAQMTAAMYSFMATCKKNQINQIEWLNDVLNRTQTINHKKLYQLLPNNWEKYKDES